LYDQTFGNVAVGSNGHLTFGTVNDAFNPTCIPIVTATYAIFPYETDQCTISGCVNNTGSGYGIFTSVSGTAPNRIFNVEWRTAYYNSAATAPTINYEVRLYEGQTAFDVIYATVPPTFTPPSARTLSVGVQRTNTTQFTLVGCDSTGGGSPPVSSGQLYHYTLGGCNPSPTPTSTATSTPIATPTPSTAPTVNISGTVTYCTNPGLPVLPGVTMTLTGTSGGSTTTDGSGNYSFTGLTANGNYTVTPTKTGLSPGSPGINTVDVIAVQRHFLNIALLTGCKLAAADVNGDTAVNTVDVIAVQRFFLFLTTGVANAGKYKFNPVIRSYTGLVTNQVGQNYDTIVFGDVAASYVH
jgi:hypothetical protein